MQANQKINYVGGMDNYNVQVDVVKFNYDELCAMGPERIQEMRDKKMEQAKGNRNRMLLYGAATAINTVNLYNLHNNLLDFGDYHNIVVSVLSAAWVMTSFGAAVNAYDLVDDKASAKMLDKALVLVTGDAMKAHYKSTMDELVKENRFLTRNTMMGPEYKPNAV